MSDTQQRERSPRVREIEFDITAPAYPFVQVSVELDCRIELAEMIPRGNGRYAEFFTVSGGEPSRVEALVSDHEGADVRCLREHENGALLEVLVAADCPAVELAKLGALPRTVRSSDGTGRIVAEVPSRHDAGEITNAFLERVPEAEFVAKRKTDTLTPPFSRPAFRQELRSRLTDASWKSSRPPSRPATTTGPEGVPGRRSRPNSASRRRRSHSTSCLLYTSLSGLA
ncbi:Bacterio-opsin activator HTH domain protein, partial [Natrinema versiforme JCM 10478]